MVRVKIAGPCTHFCELQGPGHHGGRGPGQGGGEAVGCSCIGGEEEGRGCYVQSCREARRVDKRSMHSAKESGYRVGSYMVVKFLRSSTL